MKKQLKAALLTMAMCVQLIAPAMTAHAAQTYYDNKTGTENGYDFELWKDYGTTSMTLNGSGTFDCSWSNIGNVLFREGKKFDQTKTYSQIGNITFDYGCNYQPNGNSYLCVYGWTVSPLVEYYIVDSWGTWRPPGASAKGQITVDGGTYDVYETTRVNQPSIQGNTTFQQYWSVRTSKRTSGTISVTEHFKAWERMGMRMGNLTEAALNVEGYQSQGQASVYKNVMTIGGSSSGNAGSGNQGGNQGGNTGNENAGNNLVKVADADKIQTETMTKGGQYTGGISSPFNGVALYGNNDTVKFTQNFTKGTHDFTLRGCSNNDNMARVDLKIGGQNKGTFYFGDANPAEYTIKNVSHGTGNQTVELVVTADDGQWDAYLDWLGIGGISSEGKSQGGSSQGGSQGGSSQGSSSQGGSAQTGSQGGNTGAATESSASTKVECEKMTKSGQYTGNISSPFNGVALYANNDSVKYTQNFTSGTHDFVLRGCSNNNNMARVDLKIGGQTKGTFYYGDANPAEYTIKNVSHGTGNQTVELVVTADDGQWDAYLDSLTILGAGAGAATGAGSGSSTNPGTGSTGGNNNQNQKLIALTFDDGPSSTTNDVLDILDKYDVKATFFLIGQQVNSNTLATMQRQVRSGHELASHSYTHEDMANMSAQQVRNQMEWTSSAIKNAVGVDVKFFRPPYISVSNTMYQNSDLAFICGSLCDDYMDNVSASERARKCIANAKDGEILLLHDFQGNSKTVQALPTIIETLQNQGYRFVTVSELFQLKGKNPNVEYKLWSNVNN